MGICSCSFNYTQLDTKCYAIPVILNIYHRGWELNLDSDNLPACMPLSSDTQFRMPKSNLKIIQTSHLVSNPEADYDEEFYFVQNKSYAHTPSLLATPSDNAVVALCAFAAAR